DPVGKEGARLEDSLQPVLWVGDIPHARANFSRGVADDVAQSSGESSPERAREGEDREECDGCGGGAQNQVSPRDGAGSPREESIQNDNSCEERSEEQRLKETERDVGQGRPEPLEPPDRPDAGEERRRSKNGESGAENAPLGQRRLQRQRQRDDRSPVDRPLPGERGRRERDPDGQLRSERPSLAAPREEPQDEETEKGLGDVLIGMPVLSPENVRRTDGEKERDDDAPRFTEHDSPEKPGDKDRPRRQDQRNPGRAALDGIGRRAASFGETRGSREEDVEERRPDRDSA